MEKIQGIENRPAVRCNILDYCGESDTVQMHCWELARSKSDFRYVFNICQECIVYLYQYENGVISREDIEFILQQRTPGMSHSFPGAEC